MPSALGPVTLGQSGTHIRQSPHARVTIITYATLVVEIKSSVLWYVTVIPWQTVV